MPHKRSLTGKKKQADRKMLKYQAKQYVTANSKPSSLNIEDVERAYTQTPEALINHLTKINETEYLPTLYRTVAPVVYGSVLTGQDIIAQAAQGLITEF